MTDMTLEHVRDSLLKLSKGRMDYVELRAMADAIDAHLAKAAQGEVVETDQSIQADCYEMIADKYEAVGMSPASIVETSEYLADAWSEFQDLPDDTIDRLLVGKATEGDQSLVYGAISHIRDLQNESGDTLPADYERAVTEQAMLTECVSVTGRDPSDVIRDVIQWHVSNAAQPVEAVDALQRYDDAVADYDAEINDGWDEGGRRAILGNEVANARASLVAALAHPRPTVPEGYRLVPVEPTDDMCRNAREKIGIGSNVAHHVWHWMIAAAPDGEVG